MINVCYAHSLLGITFSYEYFFFIYSMDVKNIYNGIINFFTYQYYISG